MTVPAAPEDGRSTRSLWFAVVALLVGVVVAVLGVRASVNVNHERQQMRTYAHARSTAAYFVKNGTSISASMKRLQVLQSTEVGLMRGMRAAVEITESFCLPGDCPSYAAKSQATDSYNSLKSKANTGTDQQSALWNQIQKFQAAFTAAKPHRS